MLVSGFAEPGHGRTLRSFGERLDERGQEGVLEVVPGQRFALFLGEALASFSEATFEAVSTDDLVSLAAPDLGVSFV